MKAFRLICHLIQFHWMFSVWTILVLLFMRSIYMLSWREKKKRMKADKNEILDSRKTVLYACLTLTKGPLPADMSGNAWQFYFVNKIFFPTLPFLLSLRFLFLYLKNLIVSHIFYLKTLHYPENIHTFCWIFFLCYLFIHFCLFRPFNVVMFLMTVSYCEWRMPFLFSLQSLKQVYFQVFALHAKHKSD